MTITFRSFALLAALGLAGCGERALDPTPEPIGDFRLGHLVVLADEAQAGPFSRPAERQQIETALASAIEQRLGRYDGDGLYHLGVKVEAYVLAQPGIPVVYQPKSVLLLGVSVIDNATRKRVTDEPERIYAFEGLDKTVPLLGSGLTRTADEQLANLARNAAIQIERFMQKHPEWFVQEPDEQRVEFARPVRVVMPAVVPPSVPVPAN